MKSSSRLSYQQAQQAKQQAEAAAAPLSSARAQGEKLAR